MSDLGKKLFDAGVRVERLIWLPGAVCTDTPPEDLKDFLEDLSDDPANHIYDAVPELRATAASDDFSVELCMELLVFATGFLVQGASPVRTYTESGSYYSGWGHYRTRWFRVAAPEDIPDAIVAWAEEMAAKDLAKAGAP